MIIDDVDDDGDKDDDDDDDDDDDITENYNPYKSSVDAIHNGMQKRTGRIFTVQVPYFV